MSVASPAAAEAQTASQAFGAAGAAYQRGDFPTAATLYGRLASSGFANAAVYYNLGNSLFRLGRTGEAILAYERARRLDPADAAIQENLAFASSRIVDQVEATGDEQGPLAAVEEWHQRQPPGRLTVLFLAAWWLFNLGWAAALFAPARRWRRLGGYLLVATLLMVLVTGSLLGLAVYRRDAVVLGIVLAERVDLQSEPGGGVKLTTVHEGLQVRVRERRGDWLQVTLRNGFRGWVHGDTVGVI
jgi:tetratricopeptide (TPR) repeat protein